MMRLPISVVLGALLVACGGSPAAPTSPPTTAPIAQQPGQDLQATIATQNTAIAAQQNQISTAGAALAPTQGAAEPTVATTLTQAPTPTPAATTVPTIAATPTVTVGGTLYQADWSQGTNGWSGSQDWNAVNGMSVNDGTDEQSNIVAPFKPGTLTDYAVEAEMQLVKTEGNSPWGDAGFWIVVRSGYRVGIDYSPQGAQISLPNAGFPANNPLVTKPYDPGKDMHLYRVEAQGDTIRLFIDKSLIAEVTDETFLKGGEVGLFDIKTQFKVKSFKVIKL